MSSLILAAVGLNLSIMVVRAAQIATILPVGFDAEGNGLEGEIVGTGTLTGGVPDTTYIISGETAGNLFTCMYYKTILPSI